MSKQTEFAARVLGKRYGCDFRVVAIGPGPTAVLVMYGDKYEISLEELETIIERGLVTEIPNHGG